MNKTEQIFKSLQGYSEDQEALPPVEDWNPEFCGDIDITIKANGDWLHHGSIIKRQALYVLFSKLLVKTDQQYFLVTPVEKLAIQVEWMPFSIQDFELVDVSGLKSFLMIDNCGNKILLSKPEQLKLSQFDGLELPIVQIRRNLFASFSRSCYYRLIDQAKLVEKNGNTYAKIQSAGIDFYLGSCE